MFTSSKRFEPISVAHRQWKADSHCKYIHGYGRVIEMTFACEERDDRGWVMDFGGLKEIKQWIFDKWDHKLLIAADDPEYDRLWQLDVEGILQLMVMPEGYGPGIEDSCKYLFDKLSSQISIMTDKRVRIQKVRIYEHENNWAEYGE